MFDLFYCLQHFRVNFSKCYLCVDDYTTANIFFHWGFPSYWLCTFDVPAFQKDVPEFCFSFDFCFVALVTSSIE